MPKRIVVINGHPDNRPERFCSSVVATYVDSALKAGHDVRQINVGKLSFPFLVRFEDFQVAPTTVDIRKAQEDIGYKQLIHDNSVSKISVVGVGMRSHAGVAAQMFKALADRGINVLAITTSEIKVSVLIHEDYTELAVRVLHTAYGLDSTDDAA